MRYIGLKDQRMEAQLGESVFANASEPSAFARGQETVADAAGPIRPMNQRLSAPRRAPFSDFGQK
jgi:hypothetical protein